jgi:hypothetical protein
MAEAGAPLMLAVSWVRAPLFVKLTLPAAVLPVVAAKVAMAVFVGGSLGLSSLHPRAVKIDRPIRRELICIMAVISREVEVKAQDFCALPGSSYMGQKAHQKNVSRR